MAQLVLRVLLVDDDQDYYVLTRDLLSEIESGGYELTWTERYADGLAAMVSQQPDVCLLDYDLGEHTGVELLQAARRAGSEVPVIMLTGHGDYQIDLAAMQAGAADYLSKGAINSIGLERAIRYTVERTRTLRAIRERERHIAELYKREQDRTRELERAYSDLRRAETSRDDLVHMLMHDLRGPLSTILINLDLMTRATGVPAEAASLPRLLVRTRVNVRRILDMIDDLLKMSRLEGGTLQPNRAAVDLATWLNDRAIDYRSQADRENKLLSVQLPPDLPVIQVDADLVGRVVDNLVANALKFTPSGGHIAISASCRDSSLVISVKDDGPGVASADQERIFDKYYQVGTAELSSTRRGIGIGLTFCRLAVEAHGGSIWVESAPDQASVFSFSLPVDCGPEVPA
jgi:signal transduction histidine kinase